MSLFFHQIKFFNKFFNSIVSGSHSPGLGTAGTIPELYRLDANGRLPMTGFLSDTLDLPLDICSLIQSPSSGSLCEQAVPEALRTVILKLPLGYASNPGSYEECLGMSASDGLDNRYCTLQFKGPDIGINTDPWEQRKLGVGKVSFEHLNQRIEFLKSLTAHRNNTDNYHYV